MLAAAAAGFSRRLRRRRCFGQMLAALTTARRYFAAKLRVQRALSRSTALLLLLLHCRLPASSLQTVGIQRAPIAFCRNIAFVCGGSW